jgi:Silicon transporter
VQCIVAYTGDNLKRFLLGRQFMVVLVVFAINNAGHAFEGAELWNLPEMIDKIFFGAGLSMIFFTVMVGQLSSEVNASVCMLDYINNYFAVLTLYVSLALEFSGILHSGYVIQMVVEKLAGKEHETNEPPRTGIVSFFWIRCLGSCTLLVFAFFVTLKALFEGKTTMWAGVPPYVAIVIFFALMSVVGLLEATQIAYFAVAKMRKEDRGTNMWARKSCEILYQHEDTHGALNLAGYMIGRQLCVVSCMFFVARVTSLNIKEGEPNFLGVSDWAQAIFNTGLLGAFIVTIVASIAWRLAGNAFPIFFLSTPPAYIMLRVCMFLDATGICNGARVIAWVHAKVCRFELDEKYIGSADERAAIKMEKGKVSGVTANEESE